MNHLLQQIRNPVNQDNITQFNLIEAIEEVIERESKRDPKPVLSGVRKETPIVADREKLQSVFVHLINNAQDATNKTGEVTISVRTSTGWVVIFVQDTGAGMSDTFVKEDLFKPFSSTKGLTGMGIGVYQSREYIRKIGGSIDVTSEIGVGTCFTIKVPLISTASPPQFEVATGSS
jgi:signal transduction histidine kinase